MKYHATMAMACFLAMYHRNFGQLLLIISFGTFLYACVYMILYRSFLLRIGTGSFNATRTLPLYMKFSKPASEHHGVVNVMISFAHAEMYHILKRNFMICLGSLFIHSTSPLHLHVLTDVASLESAIQIIEESVSYANISVQVTFYEANVLIKTMQEIIEIMKQYFSSKHGSYYSDALFYVSTGIYKVLPLKKVIVLDADVKFLEDIKVLYAHFDNFSNDALIGIANEQQPVYRHILHEYRKIHNRTKVGEPPPNGLTGFNSGVLLLNLEKMRKSTIYSYYVNNDTAISYLIKKYKFKGHLGDQDFYSLLNLEHSELFYILPCYWNRQLCQWWRWHGYWNVFELYHTCLGKVCLIHGNCNTFIPEDG